MKKVLSLCLVMVLVLSLMIVPANAASVAKDIVVGSTYSEALELNKDNSTSWGGLPKINQHILYQFMLVSEGLKVKITIPANELELDSYISNFALLSISINVHKTHFYDALSNMITLN